MPATLLITMNLTTSSAHRARLAAHGGLLAIRDVLRVAANARWCRRCSTPTAAAVARPSDRLATAHQRHVLTIMDKGCVYPVRCACDSV